MDEPCGENLLRLLGVVIVELRFLEKLSLGLIRLWRKALILAHEHYGIVDRLKNLPPWVGTVLIAMLPIFELRGAIPVAYLQWNMPIWQAFLWSILGNMIPIPLVLWLLGPVSDWMMRHSRTMERFFHWLFARTRRKHSKSFERWREIALMLFVAIPLPGTGAWTGALAAFVFGIPNHVALPFIFFGVIIAGVVVSLVVVIFEALPWWLTAISAGVLVVILVGLYLYNRREVGGGVDSDPQDS